jgi:hypothetical protein
MTNIPNYNNALKFSEMADESGEIIGSLGTIYLTGGGYVDYPLSGCSPDSPFGWQEFVWRKAPSRNSKLVFNTMDDIDVGRVARCELNIKYMHYDDYCVFRHIVNSERHFLVKFFDVDSQRWVTRDMYCSENSKSKLYTMQKSLFGVVDVKIKLVGTNLDLTDELQEKKYTISYNLGDGSGAVSEPVTVTRGSQVVIADQQDVIAPTGKHMIGWQTKNDSGEVNGSYLLNQSITVWKDLNLYAWFE